MANPELKAILDLENSSFNRKMDEASKSIDTTARKFKSLGKDIGDVSRTLTFFAGAVTASLATAFTNASKDIPEVANKLRDVSQSFQNLSNNVATATLPTLNTFAKTVNGISNAVSKFVTEHQVLVNQFIKYTAIAVGVATLGFAIGQLIKGLVGLGSIISKIIPLFALLNIKVILLGAAFIALAAGLFYVINLLSGGKLGNFFEEQFSKMSGIVKKFLGDFQQGFDELPEKAIRPVERFVKGFKSNFEDLGTAIETFGKSIGSSLEGGLSTAIFDTITGKIQGVRSLLLGFADDVLKAFSKLAANKILESLFGGASGGASIFGKLGELLGFGAGTSSKGSSIAKKNEDAVRDNTKGFRDLSQNLRLFAFWKDRVIDKFREFTKLGQKGGRGGFATGGVSGGIADLISSNEGTFQGLSENITNAIEPLTAFNGVLGITTTFTQSIGTGFDSISQRIIDMGKTYVATQGVMVAASAVASALTVGIVAAASSALASLWAPVAILASIATLGGAAGIGVAAVSAAVGSAPAIAGAGKSFGGGTPSLEFGSGAFGDGIPRLAEGGIVQRPTLALVGEAGPEAVVPLNKKNMGGSTVNINIQEAVLNNPSNMRQFVNMLKEELVR